MSHIANSALSWVRRVRVGTMNAPKLEAVRAAFAAFAPQVQIDGVVVDSGVPEQPVGYDEIIRGARNRASLAAAASECDFGVGIEDGLVPLPTADCGATVNAHMNVGCAAVTDGSATSLGLSSAFAYPPQCAQRAVRDRAPIGELFDALWADRSAAMGFEPSAECQGNIGKLSLGVLVRSEYARHAIVCALVRFLHPDLYVESAPSTQGVA